MVSLAHVRAVPMRKVMRRSLRAHGFLALGSQDEIRCANFGIAFPVVERDGPVVGGIHGEPQAAVGPAAGQGLRRGGCHCPSCCIPRSCYGIGADVTVAIWSLLVLCGCAACAGARCGKSDQTQRGCGEAGGGPPLCRRMACLQYGHVRPPIMGYGRLLTMC